MLFSDLPFARLRQLLLDLGFEERIADGKYRSFYHPASRTHFPMRLYGSQDRVSVADLVTVRSQLDWNGLLSAEAFDTALRKASA